MSTKRRWRQRRSDQQELGIKWNIKKGLNLAKYVVKSNVGSLAKTAVRNASLVSKKSGSKIKNQKQCKALSSEFCSRLLEDICLQ